jgi:hypothetical protein
MPTSSHLLAALADAENLAIALAVDRRRHPVSNLNKKIHASIEGLADAARSRASAPYLHLDGSWAGEVRNVSPWGWKTSRKRCGGTRGSPATVARAGPLTHNRQGGQLLRAPPAARGGALTRPAPGGGRTPQAPLPLPLSLIASCRSDGSLVHGPPCNSSIALRVAGAA